MSSSEDATRSPRPPPPAAACVVGEPRAAGLAVGVRTSEHRLDAELVAGADDTDGDLAPIGDEHALDPHGYREFVCGVQPHKQNLPGFMPSPYRRRRSEP